MTLRFQQLGRGCSCSVLQSIARFLASLMFIARALVWNPLLVFTAAPASGRLASGRLSMQNLKKLGGQEAAPASPRSRSRASGAGATPGSDAKKDGRIAMMRLRSSLKKEVQDAIETHTGPKSILRTYQKVLAAFKAQVGEENLLKELGGDPHEVEQALRKATGDFKALEPQVADAKLEDVQAKADKVQECLESIRAAEDAVQDMQVAIDFAMSESKSKARQESLSKRYQVQKVIVSLVGGGFGKVFAKRVSQAIDPEGGYELPNFVKIDPERFDYTYVTLVNKDRVGGTPLEHASEIEGHLEDTIGKKIEDCRKAADKNSWQGTLAKLDYEYPRDFSYGFLEPACEQESDRGAGPWLCGVRRFAWRWGPAALPMPGLGNIIRPVGADLVAIVYKLEELLRSGIAVNDLHAFLETDSGKTFAAEHCAIVKVPKAATFWVPYGWGCSILYYADRSSKDPEVQFALCFTIFVPTMAKQIATNCWAAIAKWNAQHLEKNRASRLYQARDDLWQRFEVEVAGAGA
jgi:hypothetical protein